MTDLRKAAEMALEFVSWFASDDHSIRPKYRAPEIAEALRQALAQPDRNLFTEIKEGFEALEKREWVGLTDEEIENLWEMAQAWNAPKHFYILIAAKLKERNT
jgi:hypothetical protein